MRHNSLLTIPALMILAASCVPLLAQQSAPVDSRLVLPAGAWVSIRLNQGLSSNHNQAGDTFTATLAEPLIADGMVVARRGQTVMGRVVSTTKAGRIKGTSQLAIEVVELGLVDGQNVPVRTQFVETVGGPSKGRDAQAIGATTALGTVIGGAAGGGSGAGIGALAGAGASAIGVLITRGRSVEIHPEELVKFRTVAPLEIDTQRAAHAFQPVRQDDYAQPQMQTFVRRQAAPPSMFYDPFWGGGWGPGWGMGWGPGWGYYGRPTVIVRGGGFRRMR